MSVAPRDKRTPYDKRLQEFSDNGHLCAQQEIYPLIFPESDLQFVPLPEEQAMVIDADMGMDRRVLVRVHSLRESFQVMVQERFREPKWAGMQDITVTEWNNNSNRPGELYKIKAEMFLYAYYNKRTNSFLEAIALSVLNLKIKLAQRVIPYTIPNPNKRSNQTFMCFKFDDLEKHHIAVFRKKWKRDVNPYVSPDVGRERAKHRLYAAPAKLTDAERAILNSFPSKCPWEDMA